MIRDVQRDDSQGGGARDRDVYPKSAFTPDSKSLITSYDGKLWRKVSGVSAGQLTNVFAPPTGPLLVTVDKRRIARAR